MDIKAVCIIVYIINIDADTLRYTDSCAKQESKESNIPDLGLFMVFKLWFGEDFFTLEN